MGQVSERYPTIPRAYCSRTDGCEFRSDMQNHDHCHPERNYVHERGGTLKYDGIRNLDVSRIAVGDDSRGPGYRRRWPDEGTQRQRRLLTYRVELAEPHDAGDVLSGATNSVFSVGVGGRRAKDWTAVSTTTGRGGTVE